MFPFNPPDNIRKHSVIYVTHSVHRGITPLPTPTPSKTLAPFSLLSLLLNLQIVQAPLFRQFPPIYWFFMITPKNRIFQ